MAQLAGVPIDQVKTLDDSVTLELKQQASRQFFFGGLGAAPPGAAGAGGPMGGGMPAKKEVVKEGLSEYFIYTIEGRETIPSGWSKRLSSLEAKCATAC
ncbi:MAG: hypothetical protein U0894_17135 [Pirellulales bacterium]